MRILLAEDAALLREGLVALLERAGHSVTAGATATELDRSARSMVVAGEVDLVLTDVRMPPGDGDDGLRVAVGLRAEYPELPVVVLSQYVTHAYATTLLGADATELRNQAGVGYLLKDRVSRVHDFLQSLETVRAGGIVVDPEVISSLLQRSEDTLEGLTEREREVLAAVSTGATNHEIAAQLHLSEGAVVKHISSVFDKLGLPEQNGNRRVLAVLAYLRS